VCDGEVITADEETIRAEALAQGEALSLYVATDPMHKRMVLSEAMEAGRL